MDLNSFINQAVGQVRNAKKKGKQGRDARKALSKSQQNLEETRQKIKELALKCEKAHWRETKLVMLRVVSTCKNCGEDSPACIEAVYLETVHRKLGKQQKQIPDFEYASYPHLPREIVDRPYKSYICASCFENFNANQLELSFEKPKEKDPIEFLRKSKMYEKFHEESENWDRRVRMKLLRSLLPQVPLLTHQPEINQC